MLRDMYAQAAWLSDLDPEGVCEAPLAALVRGSVERIDSSELAEHEPQLIAVARGHEALLREHGCPVLVGGPPFRRLESVLVPFDPSVRVGVVAEAIALGVGTGAMLTFLHVHDVNETCEPDETLAQMRAAVKEQALPQEKERLRVRFEVGIGEGVGEAINQAAEAHDLVLVGARGRRGLARFVLGSVADVVARAAPVPVLVVRPQ